MDTEVTAPTPVQEVAKPTPAPDLLHKIETLRVLSATNRLLNEGHFPVIAHEAIIRSVQFLKGMHEKVLAESLAHPDSPLVAELEALRPKAVENG